MLFQLLNNHIELKPSPNKIYNQNIQICYHKLTKKSTIYTTLNINILPNLKKTPYRTSNVSTRDLYSCYILDNLLVFEETNWMNMGLK